jgi:hypothetical protein
MILMCVPASMLGLGVCFQMVAVPLALIAIVTGLVGRAQANSTGTSPTLSYVGVGTGLVTLLIIVGIWAIAMAAGFGVLLLGVIGAVAGGGH